VVFPPWILKFGIFYYIFSKKTFSWFRERKMKFHDFSSPLEKSLRLPVEKSANGLPPLVKVLPAPMTETHGKCALFRFRCGTGFVDNCGFGLIRRLPRERNVTQLDSSPQLNDCQTTNSPEAPTTKFPSCLPVMSCDFLQTHRERPNACNPLQESKNILVATQDFL